MEPGLGRARPLVALGGLDHLGGDRLGFEVAGVDRVAVGVAGPVLATHDRAERGGGPPPVAAHPAAAHHRELGGPGAQRPERLQTARRRRGGHRGDPLRPLLGGRLGGGVAPAAGAVAAIGGGERSQGVLGGGDPPRLLGEANQPVDRAPGVAAHLRDPDPAAGDEAKPQAEAGLGDVLVDGVPGEAGEGEVVLDHPHLGLPLGHRGEHGIGEGEALLGGVAEHQAGPTETSRKRQGAAPWPTCMICIGSPLPQFTTPHIRHSSGPATASQEPQNSGVMPR